MQKSLQLNIMEAKDAIIKMTSETLIKAHGSEPRFLMKLLHLRETERSWLMNRHIVSVNWSKKIETNWYVVILSEASNIGIKTDKGCNLWFSRFRKIELTLLYTRWDFQELKSMVQKLIYLRLLGFKLVLSTRISRCGLKYIRPSFITYFHIRVSS